MPGSRYKSLPVPPSLYPWQYEKNAIKENFISNRVFPSIPILNDTAFASRTSLYPFQRFILFFFLPIEILFLSIVVSHVDQEENKEDNP